MDNCIFCKIARHEIPSKIIYEDDVCMAFLDLSQATDGHMLVIPKQHFDHFLDVDQKTLQHLIGVAQEVGQKLLQQLNAKGMNVITNMNEVAGQTVKHFHIHLIPRYQENEGFSPQYTDRSQEVDIDDIYHRIMND